MANEYGNYATLDPLNADTLWTFSEGNKRVAISSSTSGDNVRSTINMSSGKWYWEILVTDSGGSGDVEVGICLPSSVRSVADGNQGLGSNLVVGWSYHSEVGKKYFNGTGASYGDAYTDGDVIGVALDLDNGNLFFSKNDTWQNSATSGEIEAGTTTNAAYTGLTDTYHAAVACSAAGARSCDMTMRFDHSDVTGTVPSGFTALATQNLPTPAVINYENEYYIEAGISHTNGSTTAVTLPKTVSGGAMVRIKETDGATDWYVFDTVRGANKSLQWNTNSVEDTSTFSDQNLTGTTLTLPGALASGTYLVEVFYVGVYFQILTWTGTTAAISKTYATELDNELGMMCTMHRDDAYSDVLYHKDLSSVEHTLFTDGTGVEADRNNFSAQSAAGFTAQADAQAADININTKTYVTYAWANSGPYSFGTVTVNNSADGAFVSLPGAPAVFGVKDIVGTSSYTHAPQGLDTNVHNSWDNYLFTDTTAVKQTNSPTFDRLANGLKFRVAWGTTNKNIYWAWGIQPLTDGGVNQGRAR